MIDELIAHHLTSIDDLAELKVTLVVLRLIEQRNSASAHVTMTELAHHPALRDGLGAFARLSLEMALRKAMARGTLLCSSEDLSTANIFANTPASRLLIEQRSLSTTTSNAQQLADVEATLRALAHEIERLESIDIYAISDEDRARVEDWLAQGYTESELQNAARAALRTMRKPGAKSRDLKHIAAQIKATRPAEPSKYYEQIIARTTPLDEIMIAFRELNSDRMPNSREYTTIRECVGLFGLSATRETLIRSGGSADALHARLAEQQEAELAIAHRSLEADVALRELLVLYSNALGGTATSTLADEIKVMLTEQPDLEIWRAAFSKATREGKKNWAYVRAIVRNPSPNLLLPEPINETARRAFELYRKRAAVRGILDISVARDINVVAGMILEGEKWEAAFDVAAAQNALNWNYIKAVLLGTGRTQGQNDGKRSQKTIAKRGAKTSGQREQIIYTEESRIQAASNADAELAELEERRKRRNSAR